MGYIIAGRWPCKISQWRGVFMRFMENKKLAARIGIITTIITLVGMALLWLVVATNSASVVKNDITI